MGTMVIALDPGGNPFGLWQAGMHTGARIYNEPGALYWNEAAVEDPAAARAFLTPARAFTTTDRTASAAMPPRNSSTPLITVTAFRSRRRAHARPHPSPIR